MTSFNDPLETPSDLRHVAPEWGWKGLAVLGTVMLLGGFVAFFNPFAASLTVEIVAGAAFVLAGVMQLWLAFSDKAEGLGDRVLSGALGAVLILLAVWLILNPLAGLVTLTFMVAVLFAVMGALRMALAWRMRPLEGWGWVLASGIVSLVLAAVIVLALPGAALGLLGLFLGIDLTASGIVTLSLAIRRKAKSQA